jgi:hypothetical protein
LGGLAGLSLLAAGCEQPDNECRTANLPFAARFTKTSSADDSCRILGEGYKGDIIGVQTYNRAQADDPTQIDLERSFIAIKAFTLQAVYHRGITEPAGVGDPDVDVRDPGPETRQLYALGDFTSADPSDDLCTVPTFRSRAEYQSTELPPTTCGAGGGGGAGGAGGGDAAGGAGGGCVDNPGIPALNVTYDWNNFKMVERSDAPGTAFTVEMTYSETQTTEAAGATTCAATYNVIAIAPAVDCSVYDADGHLTGERDASLCLPEADPDAGRVAGSGLNPKLTEIIDCVDAGQAVLGFQCALMVDSIEEVRDTLEKNTE